MNKMKRDLILYMVAGFVLTLTSAATRMVSLVGATRYGFPLPWIARLVLHPDIYPWRIMAIPLCVDVIFWGFLSYIVIRYVAKD